MAEERNPVVPPVRTPVAPDLPVSTPLTSSELDDVDVPRSVDTSGLGPGGSADRIDVVATPGATAAAGTGAIAADDSDDPDAIREQIERTREDMSQTINELQERLSPERLAQQAKDTVREATVGRVQHMVGSAGETASQIAEPVMEQVRERPVPVALLGASAGLAWWLMRRASSRQTWSSDDMYNWDDNTNTTRTRNYDDRTRGQWQGESGWTRVFRDNPVPASLAAASIGYMLWNQRSSNRPEHYVGTRSTYGGGFDEDLYSGSSRQRSGDSGRGMGQQAREKANELGQKASETASEISHQVTDTVRSARQQVNRMSRNTSTQFEHWMQENPLAVGIAAMAAGAMVGLTVPVTRAENRTLGASRDALMERATDTAMQLKDQVRDKVQEVAGDLTNQGSGSGSNTNPSSTTSSPTTMPGTTGL